jgi:hypothetical protein
VAFQGVVAVWPNGRHALGTLQLPNNLDASAYQIHPSLLDAGFQVALTAASHQGSTYLPIKIEGLQQTKR